jgi:protein-S-isoprenylcysteine O-methyltransferase Ste14
MPYRYGFLFPLLLGFGFDLVSTFTAAFSRRWGKSRGELATFVLRNICGLPLWIVGLGYAVRSRSPFVFTSSGVIQAFGWLLLAIGATVQLFAIARLQLRAAKPSIEDALVARGVYAHIRHPIYAGIFLEFAALILVEPRQTVILCAAIGWAWAWAQARLEEVDLLQRMPAYQEYMRQVPRFFPRISIPGGRDEKLPYRTNKIS